MKRRRLRLSPKILAHARELRRNASIAERVLWNRLRGRQLAGATFRRQQVIGRYIADFYCAESSLVIELDGRSHNNSIREDVVRTEFLRSRGYRVVRFTNDEVLNNLDSVLMNIAEMAGLKIENFD